ncbi:MAG: hypothetical protein V4738_04810 [Pseudomonadota bacterium]
MQAFRADTSVVTPWPKPPSNAMVSRHCGVASARTAPARAAWPFMVASDVAFANAPPSAAEDGKLG